jgi:hypothetical protein
VTRATLALLSTLALAGGIAAAQPPAQVSKRDAAATKEKRRIVGILDVRVDGVPPEVGAQFQKNLEAQLDSKHYWLAPRTRVHELMSNSTKWTEGCVVGKCLHEVNTQTGADVVLLAALNGSGTSFGFVVTAVRTDTGHVIAQESDRCDVCTVNEALTAATLAAVKIISAVPDTLPSEDAAPAPAPVMTAPAPAPDAPHHQSKAVGIALTVVGVVAGAAGGAIYAAKNHASYGLATAAAGGGLAAGGIVVLSF